MPRSLPVLDLTEPVRCAALTSGPLDEGTALQIALRLTALSDPVRVRLMSLVLAQAERGARTCDLAPTGGVSEAPASHHLEQRRDAGPVEGIRSGANVFSRPRPDVLGALCRVLDPHRPDHPLTLETA